MEIKEDEIKEVRKLGTLNGSEVKLVTLKGGFHIGMGKKDKNCQRGLHNFRYGLIAWKRRECRGFLGLWVKLSFYRYNS